MNARTPLFMPDRGVGAYEKMALGGGAAFEVAEGRAIGLINDCQKFADALAKRLGAADSRPFLLGALEGQIKALCQEADAAGLPPTALSELTVKGDGDMTYTVRYEVDTYGDIDMREIYSSENLLGALSEVHTDVIEDEVTRLHLKGLCEDAGEALIAAGRARLDTHA